MTRPGVLVLLGGMLLAMQPHAVLPLPPPLPADPPTDEVAPMPNDSVSFPANSGPAQSTFALRIYRMRSYSTGDGFIPGSAYESPEDRKPMQTPGFMVTVPLQ